MTKTDIKQEKPLGYILLCKLIANTELILMLYPNSDSERYKHCGGKHDKVYDQLRYHNWTIDQKEKSHPNENKGGTLNEG